MSKSSNFKQKLTLFKGNNALRCFRKMRDFLTDPTGSHHYDKIYNNLYRVTLRFLLSRRVERVLEKRMLQ